MHLLVGLVLTFFVYQPIVTPSGKTIVSKSIEFHDPNNNWKNLQAHLNLVESRPNIEDKYTSIDIDNIRGNFCSKREVNKMHVQRHLVLDSCFYNIDEYEELTDKEIEAYRLNKQRSLFLRNNFLYFWGLPMKLNDEGTIIGEEAIRSIYNGKEAYEVKVLYKNQTGSDVKYFYFDLENFAMIGYRFYNDVDQNDGEYIVLKDNELVFGIQMPKSRSWYAHEDSIFLGKDILTEFDDIKHEHY